MYRVLIICVLFLLIATNIFAKQWQKFYSMTDNEKKKSSFTYKIDDEKSKNTENKTMFTDIQLAKIEYFEMERNSKILALEKDLQIKRKVRDNEISKPICDVYVIDALTDEIKLLVTDIEQVIIDTKKKIRNILSAQQYIEYNLERNQKFK